MKAGKYTLSMTVKTENKEWQLKKPFRIIEEKATELNKTDVSKQEEAKDVKWFVIALVVGILLLINALMFVLKRK